MNKTTITILATIGALILAIAIYFVVKTNIQAQVIRLDNAVTASVERQTTTHDALWKTIKGGRVMSKEADSLAYETIRAWSNLSTTAARTIFLRSPKSITIPFLGSAGSFTGSPAIVT